MSSARTIHGQPVSLVGNSVLTPSLAADSLSIGMLGSYFSILSYSTPGAPPPGQSHIAVDKASMIEICYQFNFIGILGSCVFGDPSHRAHGTLTLIQLPGVPDRVRIVQNLNGVMEYDGCAPTELTHGLIEFPADEIKAFVAACRIQFGADFPNWADEPGSVALSAGDPIEGDPIEEDPVCREDMRSLMAWGCKCGKAKKNIKA